MQLNLLTLHVYVSIKVFKENTCVGVRGEGKRPADQSQSGKEVSEEEVSYHRRYLCDYCDHHRDTSSPIAFSRYYDASSAVIHNFSSPLVALLES